MCYFQWRTSLASVSCELTWPTFFWLQLWRFVTVALNFLVRVSKGQWEVGSDVQAAATTSWKPSRLVQKASKWNLAFPGWTSFKPRRRGQWSDPSVAQLCSGQLGSSCSQSYSSLIFFWIHIHLKFGHNLICYLPTAK